MTGSAASLDVVTADGVVRGRRWDGLLTWRGVPYAEPPVGPLRFRSPQPVRPWSGVREAVDFGAVAPQRRARNASEDCLTLNVLTPTASAPRPRPVLVFIHGGAYVSGSSSTALYWGDHLVRRGDIVYVSINYRLGALGYFDFGEYSTPNATFEANLGLRDQIAALHWIKRNIAAFGGDPDNVTIAGQSAGANAVTTLMCVPSARGMFARAIAESSPVGASNPVERARGWSRQYLDVLGADPADAANALLSAAPEALVAAEHTLSTRIVDEQPGRRVTAPTFGDDLLPEHPLDAFAGGTANPVPLIIGTNSHEGRFFSVFLDVNPTKPSRIEPMLAHTDPAVRTRALAAYPGYPRRTAATDLGGEITYWLPSVRCAQEHTRRAPTYSYRYDFSPRLFDLTWMHATHGTELLAVFGVADDRIGRIATLLGGRAGLRAVTETVQAHWLSFIKNGTPLPSWPTYSTENRETLIIDAPTRVENDPNGDRRQAWTGYQRPR